MSFAITGLGRSGTLFLAKALGRSRAYKVVHEPLADHRGWFAAPYKYDRGGHLAVAARRFKRGAKYGEVNSFLRFLLMDLPVDHRAVIVRRVDQLVLSHLNRNHGRWAGLAGFHDLMLHLNDGFRALASYADRGVPVIHFDRMTSDSREMERICGLVGIDDVDASEIDLSRKVNANKKIIVHSLDELPAWQRERIGELAWFTRVEEKYRDG